MGLLVKYPSLDCRASRQAFPRVPWAHKLVLSSVELFHELLSKLAFTTADSDSQNYGPNT